ncbi:MAG: DUF362 domain-containing protein [Candidatus Hydrothermarchaeales archaeon]
MNIIKEICVGCGHCVPFCPNEAIIVFGSAEINHEKCEECKICIRYCPLNAISEDAA